MGASGGDGIRTMDARSIHRRATPKVIGSGVPYSGNMVTRKGGLFPEAFAKEGPAGMPGLVINSRLLAIQWLCHMICT